MDTLRTIPFFENRPDALHCFQASCKMILKYFLPHREFSWEELDQMSGKLSGKATWPQQMLITLSDMGFDIVLLADFDAEAFIKEGKAYLEKSFGKDVAGWQAANSDLAREQELYARLLDSAVRFDYVTPSLDDMAQYLEEGYLLAANVNGKKLNDEDGYNGHWLVVYGLDAGNIMLQDPGHPARERRVETRQHFDQAWPAPKTFFAIRYKEL